MDKDIKNEWVTALRSGKHKQSRGGLTMCDAEGNVISECCLGVLTNILAPRLGLETKIEYLPDAEGAEVARLSYRTPEESEYEISECHVLPQVVATHAGLDSLSGRFYVHLKQETSLSHINDTWGTFDQIADIIEWAF